MARCTVLPAMWPAFVFDCVVPWPGRLPSASFGRTPRRVPNRSCPGARTDVWHIFVCWTRHFFCSVGTDAYGTRCVFFTDGDEALHWCDWFSFAGEAFFCCCCCLQSAIFCCVETVVVVSVVNGFRHCLLFVLLRINQNNHIKRRLEFQCKFHWFTWGELLSMDFATSIKTLFWQNNNRVP